MAKVFDLQAIARGDHLLAIALNNPNLKLPTYEDAEMIDKNNETRVIGIRFPVDLLEWVDSYSRIQSIDKNQRITRNSVVIGFLETMKAIVEHQEKTRWGKSHQEMIREILSGKQSTGDDEG